MVRNMVILLLPLLLGLGSCKAMKEASTAYSRKEDCSRFVYCPVTLVLLQGDTIRSHFTWSSGYLYQVHENADSNINRIGNESGIKNDYYPVSTWYRRFTTEEISSYNINGKTIETVIVVADKNGTDRPWINNNIIYLQRYTPDSSRIKLYVSYTPRSHGDEQRSFTLTDLLGEIASDMLFPGYYSYYIHFPGDTPHTVWPADQSPAGFAAKRKMADLLSTCPELQPLAEQVNASSHTTDLVHALLSKEELKYPKTIPSLLAILKRYDDCSLRKKQ